MYVTLCTIYINIYFLGTGIERDIIAVYERVLSGKLREDYRKTSPLPKRTPPSPNNHTTKTKTIITIETKDKFQETKENYVSIN